MRAPPPSTRSPPMVDQQPAGPVLAGRADMVLGARVLAGGHWPVHARVANRFLAWELGRRTGISIRDIGPMRSARRTDLLDLGIEDPFELTGLYEGEPITTKSVMDQPLQPDVIWLFRRPILEEWIARGDVGLARLVSHVLVHEIAHHLGWSDDEIRAVDDWTK